MPKVAQLTPEQFKAKLRRRFEGAKKYRELFESKWTENYNIIMNDMGGGFNQYNLTFDNVIELESGEVDSGDSEIGMNYAFKHLRKLAIISSKSSLCLSAESSILSHIPSRSFNFIFCKIAFADIPASFRSGVRRVSDSLLMFGSIGRLDPYSTSISKPPAISAPLNLADSKAFPLPNTKIIRGSSQFSRIMPR